MVHMRRSRFVRDEPVRCRNRDRGDAAAATAFARRADRERLQRHLVDCLDDRATHYMSRMPGSPGYPVSKAALNMLTVQYAKALSRDGILVNAAAPGACDTDFAAGLPFKLTRTAADGAAIVLRLATLGRECPTGGFFDDNGKVPW